MEARQRPDGTRAPEGGLRVRILGSTAPAALVVGIALANGCGAGPGGANPSGTLEATEIDLAPAIAGRVLEVRPQLGDRVSAGDTVVVLDTELLALERAQAEANRRSIAVQRLMAEEEIRQLERNLELTDTTLGRLRSLLAEGSAAGQQVDDLAAKRDVTASRVTAARHRLEYLAAEKDKLGAALAVFDRKLEDGILISPSSGTVLVRALERGEMAVPGAVAIRVADLTRLELRVFLGEEDLDRVRVGQTLPVLVDALEEETVMGTVTWVSPEAEFTPKNAQTRNARAQLVYAVKLRVENPDGRLHIGMPAEVDLEWE